MNPNSNPVATQGRFPGRRSGPRYVVAVHLARLMRLTVGVRYVAAQGTGHAVATSTTASTRYMINSNVPTRFWCVEEAERFFLTSLAFRFRTARPSGRLVLYKID